MKRTFATALLIAALPVAAPAGAQASKHVRRAAACAGIRAVPTAGNLAAARTSTLCLLNAQRTRHRMHPLRENPRLEAAADGHARDMVKHDYFSHDTPAGVTFLDRILGHGYVNLHQAWSVGENIAWGTGPLATPVATVNAWMHSPEHRANILQRSFRDIGIGVAAGDPASGGLSGATYATDFGRRG